MAGSRPSIDRVHLADNGSDVIFLRPITRKGTSSLIELLYHLASAGSPILPDNVKGSVETELGVACAHGLRYPIRKQTHFTPRR